ncbi:hypothetical protein HPB48_011998 [Haemaphysalis longicornis]|uniref:Uncharacterized protein n=1 Tax=Haemaphysalis longicornis TaxID=44386 RepID=A0A9J6H761_HAELO|nr:hypothetical protein HPB48_011998 [Haemaphysalis longicornis]
MLDAAHAATHELETGESIGMIDSHLVSLWRKKKELEGRVKSKKLDRNMRKRIAALNKEIKEYSLELTRVNLGNICDQMNVGMGNAKTWNIHRYLLDQARLHPKRDRDYKP